MRPNNALIVWGGWEGHQPEQCVQMPVAWKRMHGRGRVFYSFLGHLASEFEVPEMATLFRRGMLWAARKRT